MNFINEIKECWQSLSKDEKRIIFVTLSIYIHYLLTAMMLGYVVYKMIKEHRLNIMIQNTLGSKFVLAFCCLTSMVALLYGNYLGFVVGIAMSFLFMYIFYYRNCIHKQSFEFMIDLCILSSWFFILWGIVEYICICNRINHSVLELFIANSPKNRVHVGSFNANYYAMLLEFTILMCFYKGMQWKSYKHTIFYTITVGANLFLLVLTGCRTAWIPFVVSVPVLILCCGMKKLFITSMVGIGSVATFVACNPGLMKRAAYIAKDFLKRTRIWNCAIEGIWHHPLLGQGPLTYYQIYPLYNGHPTQHAHSIYLDPILSHGMIGVLLFGIYAFYNCKEIYLLLKNKLDLPLFGLILAFIITVLLHGLLDYTLFWIQTGTLFFMIFTSAGMYFRNEKEL